MAVDDVYRLSIVTNYLGSVMMNTYAFRVKQEAEPTDAQFSTLATDCKELHRLQQVDDVVYKTWRAVQVRGANVSYTTRPCLATGGRLVEGVFTTQTTGSDANPDILPPQCALVTTLRSTEIGRSRRGRIYAYGYSETLQNAGTWSTTHQGAVNTAWTTFMAKYNATTGTDPNFQLGIWSHTLASGCRMQPDGSTAQTQPPSPSTAFAGCVSHLVRPTVFSQRRRTTGVGM